MAEDGGRTIPTWIFSLRPLTGYVGTLTDFAGRPIQFLRKRVVPLLLGGIFGFVFDLAAIVRRPFVAISTSLDATGGALENAVSVTIRPTEWFVGMVIDLLVAVSAPFGWFQPFVLVALSLAVMYAAFVVVSRLLRAILDAIPGLSGVETFLWG